MSYENARKLVDENRRAVERLTLEATRRDWEKTLHTADDWWDAWDKAALLYARVARSEADQNARIAARRDEHPEHDDPCWQPTDQFQRRPEQIALAYRAYHAIMTNVEREVELMRAKGRVSVAHVIREVLADDPEFAEGLAEALEKDHPAFLVDW